MAKSRFRRLFQSPLTLAFGLAVFSCQAPPEELGESDDEASLREAVVEGGAPNCGGDLTDPVVHAEWVELPNSASVAQVSGSLTLKLRNDGPEKVAVHDVSVRTLGGGKAARSKRAEIVLAPKEEVLLKLDPAGEGIALAKTVDVSGELAFDAQVSPLEGTMEGRVIERIVAPSLYFHSEAGDLIVYGEQALRDHFGAGDVNAKHAMLVENSETVRRIAVWAPELEEKQ